MRVTIFLTTYNHEKFVACAINSLLMQKVDFDYEIVILEDCSTDRTRDIVIDYGRKHADKIRLVLSERNLNNNNARWAEVYQACRSEYIASIDGDDCWTSAYKLQKQVNFMDAHPDCALSCHNAVRFYEGGSEQASYYNDLEVRKRSSTIEDLLDSNFVAGCSPMYRRALLKEFPEWYKTAMLDDWPLYVLYAQLGTIGYMDEVLGAYRKHEGGVWTRLSRVQQVTMLINMLEFFNVTLKFTYDTSIQKRLGKLRERLALLELQPAVSADLSVAAGESECRPNKLLRAAYWPLALMVGMNEDARPLLTGLPMEPLGAVDEREMAAIIYQAVPLSTYESTSSWHRLLPVLEHPIKELLLALERDSNTPGFAERTFNILTQSLISQPVAS